jgi:hypothetical protein
VSRIESFGGWALACDHPAIADEVEVIAGLGGGVETCQLGVEGRWVAVGFGVGCAVSHPD